MNGALLSRRDALKLLGLSALAAVVAPATIAPNPILAAPKRAEEPTIEQAKPPILEVPEFRYPCGPVTFQCSLSLLAQQCASFDIMAHVDRKTREEILFRSGQIIEQARKFYGVPADAPDPWEITSPIRICEELPLQNRYTYQSFIVRARPEQSEPGDILDLKHFVVPGDVFSIFHGPPLSRLARFSRAECVKATLRETRFDRLPLCVFAGQEPFRMPDLWRCAGSVDPAATFEAARA